MSTPRLAPLAATLALLAPPAAPAAEPPGRASPEVAALVRRCVEAYGGPEAVARAALRREEGTVTSLLHPGQRGRIVRAYARPGRLRVEVTFDGETEVRVLDGERGWRHGQPAQGPHLVSMVLQAGRLDLPALLQGWPGRLVDRGTVEVEGKRLRALELELRPGVVLEADLDPATGRILRSRGRAEGGMPVEFVTTYGDFRPVKGLLVPFHEGNWANGSTTGETVLTKVDVPETLPDATFRP